MASSQRDMFSSSPEKSPRMSSSLPPTVQYTYLWCILFDWDENEENPFKLYQVAMFHDSELKPSWISGELDQNSRQKKIMFSAIRGKTFSLFGKVEKCKLDKKTKKKKIIKKYIFLSDTESQRRLNIVSTLNEKYSEFIETLNIKQAYEKMVYLKPYKVLSCFVYDWTYVPLKRGKAEEMLQKAQSPKPVKITKNKAAKKCFGTPVNIRTPAAAVASDCSEKSATATAASSTATAKEKPATIPSTSSGSKKTAACSNGVKKKSVRLSSIPPKSNVSVTSKTKSPISIQNVVSSPCLSDRNVNASTSDSGVADNSSTTDDNNNLENSDAKEFTHPMHR